MTIRYATKEQIEAARALCIKAEIRLQQYVQGSVNPAFIDADYNSETNDILDDLETAVAAVNDAVADTTPSAFSFVDVTGADTGTVYTSNAITVAGVSANEDIAITISGGTYSVNGAAFTSDAGTVQLGDEVRARVTSSETAETAVNAAVTIGGVSDTYTVTTAA